MTATIPTSDVALSRRVEEASLNAWPALHQLLLDGWVLRFARGFTKRANSVVPLYPSARNPLEPGARSEPGTAALLDKVRFCENLYTRENLTTIFRLTSLSDAAVLDDLLAARGYARIDPTLVMACTLDERSVATASGFATAPQAEWLDAYGAITGAPSTARTLHGLVLNGIRTPLALGLLRKPAEVGAVACGIAVLEADLVGLFDVATLPAERRNGFARTLVRSLLAWGATSGARTAYLQVVEANENARALYSQLGFEPLYRYWYRIAPR